jgi:diphthamide synthase (EF-2-diphthine--ammonia ligase)
LGEDKVGVEIIGEFVKKLPVSVDPCGENGEFHTFCYDGPIFKKAIKFKIAEKVYRPLEIKINDDTVCTGNTVTRGFWFQELLPS